MYVCVCVQLKEYNTYVECVQADDERQLISVACRQLIQFAVLEEAVYGN